MAFLNRYGVLVRPKTRYVEWANSCREDEPALTIDEARTNPAVYLIAPVLEDDEEPNHRQLLAARATEIFELELAKWNPDQTTWPANRSPHAFQAWFDAEVVTEVVDISDDEPMVSMPDDDAAEYALAHCAWCGQHLNPDDVRLVAYTPLIDMPVDARSVPVELDEDGERIVFAVRSEEFELARTDEDSDEDLEEDDDVRSEEEALDIVDRAPDTSVDDAGDDDEGVGDSQDGDVYDEAAGGDDFVLACCSEKCRDQVEAALDAIWEREEREENDKDRD
jgi:hypothetical protein